MNKDQLNPNDFYYRIMVDTDTTEGRGPCRESKFVFASYAEALKFVKSDYYARQYGVMGTPGNEYNIKAIPRNFRIYSTCDEALKETSVEVRKQKALAKLTTEERELLGL